MLQFIRMILTDIRHFLALAICALAIVCAMAEQSFAQNLTRIFTAHPPSMSPTTPKNLCSEVFIPNPKMQIIETTLREGNIGSEATQIRTESDTRSAKIDPVVDRVLNDWTQDRDYTPEQAQMLFYRDKQLDPRRTTYISYEAQGAVAIVRIFDGSSKVLKGGTEWPSATESSSWTPIEIGQPGYKLPERIWSEEGIKPSFIWELGLVDVNREIKNGVETIFNGVAKELDLHYNDHNFVHLNDLKSITSKNMMIYAQTRANRLSIFRKYGFQPTFIVGPNGEVKPFEVAPNLVLISMKAEDFLSRFYSPKLFAETKKQDSKYNQTQAEANLKKTREYLSKIDARRIKIETQQEIAAKALEVFKLYVTLRTTPGKHDQRKNLAIDFFESYLVMINSVPLKYRHKNWQNMRNLVIEVMGQYSPLEALYFFSKSIDSIGKPNRAHVSEADLESFMHTAPPRRFDLIFPTEPTLNLYYQY